MSIMEKKLYKKRVRSFVVLSFVLFFMLRLVMLDQDLPPWGLTFYTPIDEGSYSILALNEVNRGSITSDGEMPFYTPPHVRVNVIGNVMSYIGLRLLGDNYYGLRVPYVVFGCINFLLFYFILEELRKRYGGDEAELSHLPVMIAMLLFAVDFPFFMASRIAEPTMVRLLLFQLIYFVFIKVTNQKIRFFLLGSLVTISVFLVYITNVFLYISCAVVILSTGINQGRKHFLRAFIFFTLGCIVVLAVCELYYVLFWHTTALQNLLGSFTDFSSVEGYAASFSPVDLIKTVLRYFGGNSLLFNLPVLAGFLAALPPILVSYFKRRDDKILFGLTAIFAFLVQTFVSTDYIERKLLVVYPMFLFLAFIAYALRNDFVERYNRWCVRYGRKTVEIAATVYLFLSVLFICSICLYRLFFISDGTRLDLSSKDILLIMLFGLCPAVCFLGGSMAQVRNLTRPSTWNPVPNIGIAILCGILLNTVFVVRYVFLNPTYTERDAMAALGEQAGNSYILGEYENGFTLYNDIVPVLDSYENLKTYMENDKTLLYFDYADQYMHAQRYFFDEILFAGSEYTVIPIAEFPREFQTFGKKRSMALYRVASKMEAVEWYRNYFDQLDDQQKIDLAHAQFEHGGYIPGDVISDTPSEAYPDIVSDIYDDVPESLYGDVRADIYGDVFGDIFGNVYGNIYGTVHGKIYGQVYGPIQE